MGDYAEIDCNERNKLRNKIYSFSQYDNESLTESWVRFQELLKNCYGHGLNRMEQVITFYERVNSDSQRYLDLAGGGDFYYMSPNAVFHLMEELVKECELDEIVVQMVEIETSAVNDKSAPHYIDEVRRTSASENFSAPPLSEVRRTNESNGISYGKSYVQLEIEVDDGLEREEEDSKDEELFNELYELIMNDNTEEYVGDIEPEVLEDGLDGLETVSPIDEMEKGLECLETVFPNKVIKDVTVNPVEEMVEGHFDPFVEKRVTTKEDLVGVASKVEDFNPIGDVRVVEEEELEKIDPKPDDGLNGRNFNVLNIKSFVVCDFDLQDSDSVVEAYDLNAEFLEVFGSGDVGLMGVLKELDTGGVEHLYFDPFDEIRVTKEEELTEVVLDPDPKDFEEEFFFNGNLEAPEKDGIDPDPTDGSIGKMGNNLFIINKPYLFVCLPSCREKARNGCLRRKKGRFRGKLKFILIFMMILILRYTKRWVDARLNTFIILFVFAELLLLFGLFVFGIA